MIIVNPDTDFFNSQTYYNDVESDQVIYTWTAITSIFVVAVFSVVVVILNVLIAVVNDAYIDNKEHKIVEQAKNQLEFVINRWSIRKEMFSTSGKDIKTTQYIITAFCHQPEINESKLIIENLDQIEEDIDFMMLQMKMNVQFQDQHSKMFEYSLKHLK